MADGRLASPREWRLLLPSQADGFVDLVWKKVSETPEARTLTRDRIHNYFDRRVAGIHTHDYSVAEIDLLEGIAKRSNPPLLLTRSKERSFPSRPKVTDTTPTPSTTNAPAVPLEVPVATEEAWTTKNRMVRSPLTARKEWTVWGDSKKRRDDSLTGVEARPVVSSRSVFPRVYGGWRDALWRGACLGGFLFCGLGILEFGVFLNVPSLNVLPVGTGVAMIWVGILFWFFALTWVVLNGVTDGV